MINFIASLLNCVGLFLGPLMFVVAMGGALALLQRALDHSSSSPAEVTLRRVRL